MTRQFRCGGESNRSKIKLEITTLHPTEGGTGLRDPLVVLHTAKIMLLRKIIKNTRQPWMKWTEKNLGKIAKQWKVQEHRKKAIL